MAHFGWGDIAGSTRRPSERAAFQLATVLVAVHVVVDAFVAPGRGTSWTDHLAAGFVPLGIVAGAALLFPRMPVGAAAVAAAVLGVLAVEASALAISDAVRTEPRGSDWTGFLLAPGGTALLGLAAVWLWRSRKPGRLRYARRALLALGAALAAYWVVFPVGIALFATHRPRSAVHAVDLGRPYQAVTLRTADGLDLAAWYVPSRNGAAVISFPTRIGKPDQARMLARHGYGVLLVDMRGYDGSEGSPNAFGWGATKDIDAAVAWLERRPDVHDGRIGGIGFSVGGEQMLDAAAENRRLRAVVSEGAGERSVRETLIRGARAWLDVPATAVQTLALIVLADTPPPASLEDVAARIAPRAVFLIYAEKGQGGEDLNPTYFRAASEPKQIWKVPGAGHTGGFATRPAEYERRVIDFFDRTLLASGGAS